MAQGQGNSVVTKYVTEVTAGTTPAAALTKLRTKGSTFNANMNTTKSSEIRSDGAIADLARTSATSGGDISFELSHAEYEPFYESVLGGTFSTAINMSAITLSFASADNSINDSANGFSTANILPGHWLRSVSPTNGTKYFKVVSVTAAKIVASHATFVNEAAGATVTIKGKSVRNGMTKKTFTFERQYTDLTTEFEVQRGMLGTQMTLNTSSGNIVEGNFTFMGRDTEIRTTTVGTGGEIAASANPIMTATANVGTIFENGAALSGVYFKSINASLNSNGRNLDAVANLYPIDINRGSLDATFAIEAFFSNSTLLSKYIAGTSTSLAYILTDSSNNTFIVDVPYCKFSAGSKNGISLNADIMQSLTATALLSPTLNYMVQFTVIPA